MSECPTRNPVSEATTSTVETQIKELHYIKDKLQEVVMLSKDKLKRVLSNAPTSPQVNEVNCSKTPAYCDLACELVDIVDALKRSTEELRFMIEGADL